MMVLFVFLITFSQMTAFHDGATWPGNDETKQKFLRGSRGQFLQKAPLGRRRHQKTVAWIVGGHQGCMVTRIENGILKKYDAELDMKLYPGDRVYKQDDIKSVKFDFMPYAGKKIESKSGLIIVFNPPNKKESIIAKFGKFFGLVKVKFKEIRGGSRTLEEMGTGPLENATLIADRKIYFGNYFKGKTVVFKELAGKEVFRKSLGDDPVLIPGKAGLFRGKTYMWEIRRGETLHYWSLIRVLSKKDESAVKEALKQIDTEKISADEKIVKKAAYLQFVSDLYPDQIDLYWLSYHILISAYLKEDEAIDVSDVLLGRCFEHFNGGITPADFAVLDAPGCLLTVELKRAGEKRFVSPGFLFHEDDAFRLHFQTNFSGYAVILYEDEEKGEYQLVFPFKDSGYRVKSKVERYTREYEFYGGPCIEKYILIFSKNSIKEIDELYRRQGKRKELAITELNPWQKKLLGDLAGRVQNKGKELKVEFIGTKTYVTTSGKNLNGIVWFRLELKNMGKK
jgi:hypothetical protein